MTEEIETQEKNNESSIEKRQKQNKELIIEQLKKTPIISLVCEKTGVSRATLYRWRDLDKDFTEAIEEALNEGNKLINDLAESQLLAAIKDRNMRGITFWLTNRHRAYSNKVEVTGKIKTETEKLTEEQQKIVDEALKLAALNNKPNQGKKQSND